MAFGPCGSLEIYASTSLGLMKKMVRNGKSALIEARDEIREKDILIEQLNNTNFRNEKRFEEETIGG